MLVRKTAPVALLCIVFCLSSSAAVAVASGGTGTIELTVTDPVKQPISEWLMCPTTKPHGTTKAGNCATTNAKGHAKLTHVKAGTVYVSWFSQGKPEVSDFKKITVRPHSITHARWEDAGS
jgi:hypothetical protein